MLLVGQLCSTLCEPLDCSLPGSSVHGVLQARILEWVAIFLLQGIFSTQGSNLHTLCLLCCRQILYLLSHQGSPFSSVQLLSSGRLFATPWTAACQASLSITNSRSLPKLMSIELVMPSNYLIFCYPLLLLPSIFPSIRVFSNELALCIKWGQTIGVSASTSVLPMNTQGWSPLGWTGWISLQSKGLSRVFSNTTVQKDQFFGSQPSSQSNSHIHT